MLARLLRPTSEVRLIRLLVAYFVPLGSTIWMTLDAERFLSRDGRRSAQRGRRALAIYLESSDNAYPLVLGRYGHSFA